MNSSTSISLQSLLADLNALLRPEQFRDYCPNGLQIQGRDSVSKIITGVTACQDLIDVAIEKGADAILVHHGYFWRGEDEALTGIKRRRIQALLNADISLIAYHLPLDAHAEMGNNEQLGRVLGLTNTGDLGKQNNHPIGLVGEPETPLGADELGALIAQKLGRTALHIQPTDAALAAEPISSIAWCTGAAQNYIDKAIAAGAQAYISGEISEPTVHLAREGGIHFFAAGHHATERYGVQALGSYLVETYGLDVEFVDIDNPV